jgi:hypothetical protein
VACRNDALAKLRAHKRESLLQATEALLAQEIKASVDAGRLTGQDKIGVQVGKIINRHKVAKHFELSIGEATLGWTRRQDAIDAEAALDGLYVIRTSLAQRMDAPSCVRSYKALSGVERAFRSLKTVDLKVRPIHHRLGRPGARAHPAVHAGVLRGVAHARGLARADVRRHRSGRQGHARSGGAGRALAFGASARPPEVLDDGEPVHSFATLMAEMATSCATPAARPVPGRCTDLRGAHHPSAHQQRALALIQAIQTVVRNPNPKSIASG